MNFIGFFIGFLMAFVIMGISIIAASTFPEVNFSVDGVKFPYDYRDLLGITMGAFGGLFAIKAVNWISYRKLKINERNEEDA